MLTAESNFSLVIFGASGSLARLKIFPALYQLALEERMPQDYLIVGYGRSDLSSEEFKNEFSDAVKDYYEDVDEDVLKELVESVNYVSGQYDSHEDFEKLGDFLDENEESKDRVRMAYFAVPPTVFDNVIECLSATLHKSDVTLRLILEKPFGTNLDSAKELKKKLSAFDKRNVFLLDHYLGKESVFNLLYLRFVNSIFSYLIQGQYVANIQITAMESVDIEGRAGYFEEAGTLRDMMQSHIFQVLTFLTMNIPESFDPGSVHESKLPLLESLYFDGDSKDVVRGQYEGYTGTEGVDPDSKTETFAALKIGIDSEDWKGVPIYLRTGKCLTTKWTSVVVEFKPHEYQKQLPTEVESNKLLIVLQPQEKIEFYMLTKRGGHDLEFDDLTTGKPIYCSGDCLSEHARLLLEVVEGDQLLFLDFPEILEAWKVIDPIHEMFEKDELPLDLYDCKSIGPESADELIRKDGFEWYNLY